MNGIKRKKEKKTHEQKVKEKIHVTV